MNWFRLKAERGKSSSQLEERQAQNRSQKFRGYFASSRAWISRRRRRLADSEARACESNRRRPLKEVASLELDPEREGLRPNLRLLRKESNSTINMKIAARMPTIHARNVGASMPPIKLSDQFIWVRKAILLILPKDCCGFQGMEN
jgi:hypothetical protein